MSQGCQRPAARRPKASSLTLHLPYLLGTAQEGDTTPRRIEDIKPGLPLLEQYGELSLENHANANGSIRSLQNTIGRPLKGQTEQPPSREHSLEFRDYVW
jgi:hypothetical protein